MKRVEIIIDKDEAQKIVEALSQWNGVGKFALNAWVNGYNVYDNERDAASAAAVAAEREAIAQLVYGMAGTEEEAIRIAAAIRARKE